MRPVFLRGTTVDGRSVVIAVSHVETIMEHEYANGTTVVNVHFAADSYLTLPGSLEYWLHRVDAECNMVEALLNE